MSIFRKLAERSFISAIFVVIAIVAIVIMMPDPLRRILIALILLGIIVLVHELGHFITAKKVGVKVERFSIGFGPKLVGLRRGETEYRISWLPILGGYVKMAGENPAEGRKEEEGQFPSAPVSHRALIAIAGSAMNVAFAIVAIACAYMVGLPPRLGTEIGYVEPDSPASKAKIIPGDKFLSVGGYKVKNWDDIREGISINPDREIEIVLLRNESDKITVRVVPERIEGTEFGKIGISPPLDPVISEVAPNSAAAKAGFRPGDIIQAVNRNRVNHIVQLSEEIQKIKAQKKSVFLTVNRNGSMINIPLAIEFDETGQVKSLGGLSFGKLVRLNPVAAFGAGVSETLQTGKKIFQFLKRMIVRDVPAKYVTGPVGIVQVTMSVVGTGIAGTLWFTGFLSVNLGIINLLPLFITDGGLLVFLLIEKLRRKPMSLERQILVQQVGVGFIIVIFLLVTYNDILRLVRGTF